MAVSVPKWHMQCGKQLYLEALQCRPYDQDMVSWKPEEMHRMKYEEAEKMHRETSQLRRKVSGEEHPSTLTSIHNLA